MRAAEIGDELADGHAARGPLIDDGVIQSARGDPAAIVRIDGGQVGGGRWQFAGTNLARHLRLRKLEQPGNADAGIVFDGKMLRFSKGERGRRRRCGRRRLLRRHGSAGCRQCNALSRKFV